MNNWKMTVVLLTLTIVPGGMFAQTAATSPSTQWGPRAGQHEFTFGAGGATNRDFDNSLGGVNFSFGKYFSDTGVGLIRQSINYSNPSSGDQSWNGSTRIAYDQHLAARGPFRPFVGVNLGGVYGGDVRDTWAAGLEAGGKIYVNQTTFLYVMAEYSWFFRHARSLDDRFDDGQFTWTAGVGFNF